MFLIASVALALCSGCATLRATPYDFCDVSTPWALRGGPPAVIDQLLTLQDGNLTVDQALQVNRRSGGLEQWFGIGEQRYIVCLYEKKLNACGFGNAVKIEFESANGVWRRAEGLERLCISDPRIHRGTRHPARQ